MQNQHSQQQELTNNISQIMQLQKEGKLTEEQRQQFDFIA